jgi:hypothetical protein
MKQQRRHYSAKEKAKISLEAISCQLRATLESEMRLRSDKKRGCCGSTELPIVAARRSWREISCENWTPNRTNEKLNKFREHLSHRR